MTKDGRGRGVFASKFLKKGELIAVEKAIADIKEKETIKERDNLKYITDIHREMVKRCLDLTQLKRIEAIRLSYLSDGNNIDNHIIPPMDIFIKNNYKQYKQAELSIAKLNRIIQMNSQFSLQKTKEKAQF